MGIVVTASASFDGKQNLMGTYEIQSSIDLFGTFADAATGAAADPSEVTLFVRDPTGDVETITGGAITKLAVGSYQYTFTATISGDWTYKWQGTGAVVCTSPDATFTVNASQLIAG